jgi:hypothetical protein
MAHKLGFMQSPADTLELQLICNCCRQPYYPGKSWEDCLRAVVFGTEKYSICPVCTQSPPQDVFDSPAYRARCRREVRRLQKL